MLKPNGTLIFKWCETQIPLKEILALTPEKPLYGHKGGQKSVTHWMAFLKQNTGAHRMAPAAGASTVPHLVGGSGL